MAISNDFHHEARSGVIARGDSYRHAFTVGGEQFEVNADLGAPGEHYRVDKRIIDGRSPFLCSASYVARPQRWRATNADSSTSAPVAFIVAPKVGVAKVAHAGAEVELRPGQYTVCISTEPVVSHYSANSEVILSFIPDIDMVQDQRLTRNIGKEISLEGIGQLLVRHLVSALQVAPTLDSAGLAAASNAAWELLPSLLFPCSASCSPGADALRDQMKSYIELRLSEPELTVNRIAAAHYVSVRTVYRLFEQSDKSVAEYIRTRRMERCRAEVEQRLDLSLAAICQRWGIQHPKHFARQYRKYYGESPSEARSRLWSGQNTEKLSQDSVCGAVNDQLALVTH